MTHHLIDINMYASCTASSISTHSMESYSPDMKQRMLTFCDLDLEVTNSGVCHDMSSHGHKLLCRASSISGCPLESCSPDTKLTDGQTDRQTDARAIARSFGRGIQIVSLRHLHNQMKLQKEYRENAYRI